MNILIACEFSGIVRDAFIQKGHNAVSCDILPTESPGPHYQCDIFDVLYRNWDMIIAFPPCTYLCNSGVRWLYDQPGRWSKMEEAAMFFAHLWNAPAPQIAVENPIMHKYAKERIPDPKGSIHKQTVQPYEFGDAASKRTILWLKNLFPLQPTNILKKPKCGYWPNQTPSGQNKLGPSADRGKRRSITYAGIARAMASQWGM